MASTPRCSPRFCCPVTDRLSGLHSSLFSAVLLPCYRPPQWPPLLAVLRGSVALLQTASVASTPRCSPRFCCPVTDRLSGLHSSLFSAVLLPCYRPPQWLSGRASASRAGDPRIEPCFLKCSHSSDLQIGILVAALPGAGRSRVITRGGWLGVSVLRQGDIQSLICSFYLSVAERTYCVSRSVPEVHCACLLGR